MTHHLVGMAEIAEMLGVSRQRVAQLVESYDDFPPPEAELSAGRIWSRSAIETWIANHPERGPGRQEQGEAKKRRFFGGGASFHRFTDRARAAVVAAQEEARMLHHNYLGTEHLLIGLISIGEGIAFDVLSYYEVTRESVIEEINSLIGRGPELPTGHIAFTPRCQKVMEIALREAMRLKHNYIGTEHLLLALIRETDGVAWKVLSEHDLKQRQVRDTILRALHQHLPTVMAMHEESKQPKLEDRIQALEERLLKLEEEREALDEQRDAIADELDDE